VNVVPLSGVTTDTLKTQGQEINPIDMKAWDEVFFNNYKIDCRVGIYVGDNQFLECQGKTGVAIASIAKGTYFSEWFNGKVKREKGDKNKAALLFGALAIVMAGITIFNIYLNDNMSNTIASKQIQVTNDSFLKNKELKKQLIKVHPFAQKQQKRDYLNTVNQFIDVSYHCEKEGFEERKKIAKSIMGKEIYEQFYAFERFVYGDSYTSTPNDLQFYIQQYDGGQ
jgi:hypothetical protein